MKPRYFCFAVVMVPFFLIGISGDSGAQNREALCGLLPGEIVAGAAYVPGVDVLGKPVVPADVSAGNGGQYRSPLLDVVKFPVTVDLAQEIGLGGLEGLDLPPGTELDAPIYLVEVYSDGRVRIDGHEISAQVYSFCGREAPALEPLPAIAAEEKPAEAAMAPQAITQQAPVPAPESEVVEDIIWGEGF